MSDFHFLDEFDDIDFILCCLNDLTFPIVRHVLSEWIIPVNPYFMQVLVCGYYGVSLQENLLGVFHLLKGSVHITARHPEKHENQEDGSTYHAKDKVEFLIITIGVDVFSKDIVVIVVADDL